MNRLTALLVLIIMLVPLIYVPAPGVAQAATGVTVKADTNNLRSLEPFSDRILITQDGSLWIIINNTQLGWLGSRIRMSLILADDKDDPNSGGFFFNVSNVGSYGPSDPTDSPYGGVIDIYKNNSIIYDGSGNAVGKVVNIPYNGSNITVIKVDMSHFDLRNIVYIENVYLEEWSIETLYNVDVYVKIFKSTSWDAVISNNPVKIIYIPTTCDDVIIDVYTPTAVKGDTAHILVSFQRFFQKVYSIAGVSLDIRTSNLTLVKMINYYNSAEEYILAKYNNSATPIYSIIPAFETTGTPVSTNGSAVDFQAIVADYAPVEEDHGSPAIQALYKIYAKFYHEIVNETMNLTFTIECDSDTAATTTGDKFIAVKATMEVTPITDIFCDPVDLNPYDHMNFTTHNLPATYNKSDVDYYLLSATDLNITIDAADFLYLTYNINGTMNGTVELPLAPYGGRTFRVYLVMNDGKYIMDGQFQVKPCFETYIVTNDTVRAVDNGCWYEGKFVVADFGAPGDYLLVKGYGYDTSNLTRNVANFTAWLDSTELWRASLAFSYTGYVTAVFRIMNTTGYPIGEGSYSLTVGFTDNVNDRYTKPFTVVINDTTRKIIFYNESMGSPIFWNTTSYSLKHLKIGGVCGNFTVQYPFINDTFYPAAWPTEDIIEIIGYNNTHFNLTFYSLIWYIHYQFLDIPLTNGYGKAHLQNKTIPFIPYGPYTLRDNTTTLKSVNDNFVFNITTGVDVDADDCRNGTLTVHIVGAAPNATMTLNFSYTVTETVNSVHLSGEPVWEGYYAINITTNIYGTGSTAVNLRDVYPDDWVENATLDTLIHLGIKLDKIVNIGNSTFLFVYNATLEDIYDNLMVRPPRYYMPAYGDTSFGFGFHVFATYNITLTINVSATIPSLNIAVTVPDTALPGDTITVEIFPHTNTVWDLVVPEWLYDVSSGDLSKVIWYIDARLVDQATGTIVDRVNDYYVGSLRYADLDGDSELEFWFAVPLHVPFVLGEDKSYRVDVKLMFAIANTNRTVITTSLITNDGGCNNNVTVEGFVYFDGYGTYLIPGADHQVVEVLGLLELKLDRIYDGIVEINATVNDMYTYLKVNVTELLKAINNTVVQIKGDTATIIKGITRIETNLTTLLTLTRDINDTVTMIYTCCGDVKKLLDRMEGTLNETRTYVLQIRGNVSNLINTIETSVIPKFGELYHNITVEINASTDMIIANISNVNRTLVNYIIAVNDTVTHVESVLLTQVLPLMKQYYGNLSIMIKNTNATILAELSKVNQSISLRIDTRINDLNNTLQNLFGQLFTRLDQMEGNLLLYMTAYEQRLEGVIEETADDIVYNITLALDNDYNALKNLINIRADELKFEIRNATTVILAKLGDVNVTIMDELGVVKTKIENAKTEIITELGEISTSLTEYYNALTQLIKDESKSIKINVTKNADNIVKVAMEINNSLTILITGKAKDIQDLLNKLSSDMNDKFAELSSTLDAKTTSLNETMKTLFNTLSNDISKMFSDQTTTLKTEISDNAKALSDKLDALAKTLEDTAEKINGNISIFGSATLLLIVIVIGLVGYSLISGRRVG